MNILKFSRSKQVDIFEFFLSLFEKIDLFLFTHLIKNCLVMELHLKKINKLM